MNIFLSADIEGTCGIAAWEETEREPACLPFRAQMSREVAAACQGALDAGALRVLVKDGHYAARNIDAAVLPEAVQINRGWSGDVYGMMSGIQRGDWDAVLFTGYHAPAGSGGNPLAHTRRLEADCVEINGQRASEFLINAYMAGYHDVPVCFVSGDAAVCECARRLIPAISVVAVNKGDGDSSTSLHPDAAVRRIGEAVREVLDSERYHDCVVPMPDGFDIRIRYKKPADAYHFSFYPGAELADEQTLRFSCEDYMDAMRLFHFVL